MRQQKLASHAPKAGWVALGLVLALVLLLVGCSTARPAPAATVEAVPVQAPLPTNTNPPPPTEVPPSPTPTLGSSQDGRPLAARVNGQPIFLDVYEKQATQFEQALTQEGLKLEGEEGKAQLAQIRENVLMGLIKQALIEQAAQADGITITDEEVEATVQTIIAQGQGQQAFDQWLIDNNLTLDEFRATQRTELLTGKVIEHVTTSVPNTAEQVHALHIRTSDAAKAQALLDQLKAGANFADLARQSSEDTATAANGGDLGWFPKDAPLMPPQVLEVAFALQVGEISQPVKNDLGYDIIKVEAREADRPLTPEMHLYARQRAFEAWLTDQVARATIDRYVNQ
jgi:parvulin-like peptidyl-prolyl isomerase